MWPFSRAKKNETIKTFSKYVTKETLEKIMKNPELMNQSGPLEASPRHCIAILSSASNIKELKLDLETAIDICNQHNLLVIDVFGNAVIALKTEHTPDITNEMVKDKIQNALDNSTSNQFIVELVTSDCYLGNIGAGDRFFYTFIAPNLSKSIFKPDT